MKNIRIIHTNDIHSKYDKLFMMANVINKNVTSTSILLDAGDFNDFSSVATYATAGYSGLTILNKLGYDALTVGNNEGFQPLEVIEKMCGHGLVNILSCNLKALNDKQITGLKSHIIKKVDGISFLIIGVSPFASTYNEYYNAYNIKAIDPHETIRKIIKENKCDFTILLSHLGLKADIMISQSISDIDIIISGHSHHVLPATKVNNTIIAQAGERGSHVGVLDLIIKDRKIESFNHENIEITGKTEKNEELESLYSKIEEESIEILKKQKVAKTIKSLFYLKDKECNYSNLLCDYLYNNYKCDFSIINSGVTEKNLDVQDVSLYDVFLTSNSPILITECKIKGKDILKALNKSTDSKFCLDGKHKTGFRGSFLGKLHVSYNCKIVIKPSVMLYINNMAIKENEIYNIVTIDFLVKGWAYKAFKKSKSYKILSKTIQQTIIDALNDEISYKYIDQRRWEE